WHVPGTRQLAVAAPDALVVVIPDGTIRLTRQRRGRTRRHAGRFQAVETPLHDERGFDAPGLLRVLEFMERNQRQGPCAERRRIREAKVGLQLGRLAVLFVPLLAGDLAGAATNAVGDVDQ